ncbi:hypothetical protein [Bremerella cremea]|uniref:hypothetical protein n=1 Tax=Bremerella cremea TaxID=1031537 RepID=UPI0011C07B71|nr:hypothetical protein [Bremerella cremea]
MNDLIFENKVTFNGNGGGYSGSPLNAAAESIVQSPFALAAVGIVPVVGELTDGYALFHPKSTRLESAIAGGSLLLNGLTAGFAPNFSGPAAKLLRSSDEAAEAAAGGSEVGSRVAGETVTESVEAVTDSVDNVIKEAVESGEGIAGSARNGLGAGGSA